MTEQQQQQQEDNRIRGYLKPSSEKAPCTLNCSVKLDDVWFNFDYYKCHAIEGKARGVMTVYTKGYDEVGFVALREPFGGGKALMKGILNLNGAQYFVDVYQKPENSDKDYVLWFSLNPRQVAASVPTPSASEDTDDNIPF